MKYKLNVSAKGGQALLILCLVIWLPVFGWAATYYIDAVNGDDVNAGTSAQPWQTMSKAIASVQAADTVVLRSGHYGSVGIYANPAQAPTSWVNCITYVAEDNATPVFSSLGIAWSGDAYLEFNGIHVVQTSRETDSLIFVDNTAHVHFKNLYVQGSGVEGQATWQTYGIWFRNAGGAYSQTDLLIENCEITKVASPINMSYNNQDEIVIRNNTLHYTLGNGLFVGNYDRKNTTVLIEGNHIYDQMSVEGAHDSGMRISCHPITIRNNIVHSFGRTGGIVFYGGGQPADYGYSDVLIENNLIYDIHNDVMPFSCGEVGTNFTIRNNTIIGKHVVQGVEETSYNRYGSAIMLSPPNLVPLDAKSLHIYNNIFVGLVSIGVDRAALNTIDEDNNIIWAVKDNTGYGTDGLVSSIAGNNTKVLVDKNNNIVNSGNWDYFDVSGDFFVGGDDFDTYHATRGNHMNSHWVNLNDAYRLASESEAIGFANPTYVPSTDILGKLRDANPDAGCYEYGASSVRPEPKPEPEPEPEDDIIPEDAQIPDVTALRVRNNILKTGGNQSALIQCDMKEAGNLLVKIYDAKGKEVIVLFDGQKDAGRHEFTWPGMGSGGSKVGSGMYLVSMKCGSYSETKKIVVIK